MAFQMSSDRSSSINLMNRGQSGKEYRWDSQKEHIIKAIYEQRGSCILKNVMNKIRNGHDNATWILNDI
ncbi:hypothetical protein CR513_33893, partial [Mucuna pruriens]